MSQKWHEVDLYDILQPFNYVSVFLSELVILLLMDCGCFTDAFTSFEGDGFLIVCIYLCQVNGIKEAPLIT